MRTALPADVTRCLGLLPVGQGATQPCSRRASCARHTQRASGGPTTPITQWMCPGVDGYWQHYIEDDQA